MKHILLFFILISSNNIISQNTYKYIGKLFLDNKKKPISFNMHLIEKDGIISGYSITNIGLEDETKSELSGLYFKNDESFVLYETQILHTTSESPINSFCYINMELHIKEYLGKKYLEGSFTGNLLDSVECGKGTIILLEDKKIQIKKIKDKSNKIKKSVRNKKKNNTKFIRTKVLKNGDEFIINWKNKKLELNIWDPNKEDGDKIQLKINDQIILNNYKTNNKRKKIKYKLNKGENIIILTAQNTGNFPPNTSRLELIDQKIKYPIVYQLEDRKSVFIKIIKN